MDSLYAQLNDKTRNQLYIFAKKNVELSCNIKYEENFLFKLKPKLQSRNKQVKQNFPYCLKTYYKSYSCMNWYFMLLWRKFNNILRTSRVVLQIISYFKTFFHSFWNYIFLKSSNYVRTTNYFFYYSNPPEIQFLRTWIIFWPLLGQITFQSLSKSFLKA